MWLDEDGRNVMMCVMGCVLVSWIEVVVDEVSGRVRARCASESDAIRGYGMLLCEVLSGGMVDECLELGDDFVDVMEIGIGFKVEKL